MLFTCCLCHIIYSICVMHNTFFFVLVCILLIWHEVYLKKKKKKNALNRFISTLDHRLDTDLPKTSHPRLDHRVGSPHDKNIPSG